jgi:hypothetical protein
MGMLMAEEKKVELSVERVGDKLLFRMDPEALVRPPNSCCCNCSNLAMLRLEDMARAVLEKHPSPNK